MATIEPTIDITPGEGPELDSDMFVTVHYIGWVYDPINKRKVNEFDSTIKRRQPFTFRLNDKSIIEGLRSVVAKMRVHERHPRATIAPEMAYGSEPIGEKIPKNATLMFDIELLDATPGRFYSKVLEEVGSGATAIEGKKVKGTFDAWLYAHVANDRKGMPLEASYPFQFIVGDRQAMKWLDMSVRNMREEGTVTVYVPHVESFGIRGAVPRGAALVIKVSLDEVK